MVFFLNADEKVYARYGGRDAVSPDSRQSLAGLHYTMKSVLAMHAQKDKAFAPRSQETPTFIRDVQGGRRRGGCLHCHQVKEILNDNLVRTGDWSREWIYRYPLPDNLGMQLDVDRGNVVKAVKDDSPAAVAGLTARDVLQRLNGVPVHSIADAQFALDRAPAASVIDISWLRGDRSMKAQVALPAGWKKSELLWRPSMQRWLAHARLFGTDLKPEEKQALGVPPKQLAFRQKDPVTRQAQVAGVQPGDIVLGIDGQALEMDVLDFQYHVQRNYVIGDQVMVTVLRDGKRLNLAMTFVR